MTWNMPSPTTSYAGAGTYRSPYASYASSAIPLDFRAALRWCENMYENNSTYRQASERIVSYFLTDIAVGAADAGETLGDDVKEKWTTLFRQKLDILGAEYELGINRMAYGNSFVSLLAPFNRQLVCTTSGCGTIVPLRVAYHDPQFRFAFSNYEFTARCPSCERSGAWRVWDEPIRDPSKLRFRFWSPHEIHIKHDLFSNDTAYVWKIPEDYKQQVRAGELFVLERVSKQVLAAIKENELFEFDRDAIFHSREPTIAGHRNRGWGLSRLMVNSRQIWYVELLQRQNEAIAMDFIMPLRVVAPGMAKGQDDVLSKNNMGTEFRANVQRMIELHRKNPTAWHFAPTPIELHQLSGDGARLAPKDLMDQGYEILLNGIGTPMEMYKGTMQLQAAPVSLRMFEANWHHLTQSYNLFLRWVTNRICQLLQWEAVSVRHERVTHADDMQKQMAMMQMATMGQASMTNAFKQLGLDWQDEQRAIMDEARFTQEQQARMQKEMDQVAFGEQVVGASNPMMGGQQIDPATGQPMPPPGGQAGAAQPVAPDGTAMAAGPVTQMLQGQGVPQTPDEMLQTAEALAHELFGKPTTVQLSELRALKQKNPTMHGLVMQRRDEIRNRARSQGGQQLMQQQYGPQGG